MSPRMHRPSGGAVAAALLLLACVPALQDAPPSARSPEVTAAPAKQTATPAPAARSSPAPAPPARPVASARPTSSAAPAAPAPAAPAPVPLPGMVVAIDPETGEPGMPSPGQLAELRALAVPEINTSAEGLIEVHHPDGSVSIDLQGRFQQYSMARIGPDGKLRFECNDASHAACRTTRARPPAPALEVE